MLEVALVLVVQIFLLELVELVAQAVVVTELGEPMELARLEPMDSVAVEAVV